MKSPDAALLDAEVKPMQGFDHEGLV